MTEQHKMIFKPEIPTMSLVMSEKSLNGDCSAPKDFDNEMEMICTG